MNATNTIDRTIFKRLEVAISRARAAKATRRARNFIRLWNWIDHQHNPEPMWDLLIGRTVNANNFLHAFGALARANSQPSLRDAIANAEPQALADLASFIADDVRGTPAEFLTQNILDCLEAYSW